MRNDKNILNVKYLAGLGKLLTRARFGSRALYMLQQCHIYTLTINNKTLQILTKKNHMNWFENHIFPVKICTIKQNIASVGKWNNFNMVRNDFQHEKNSTFAYLSVRGCSVHGGVSLKWNLKKTQTVKTRSQWRLI